MAKYEVIISDDAQRQLGNFVLFIAEKDIDAAFALKARLVKSFESLQELPARFPFFNEQYVPANKYRKMFVDNWYLILYQIKDNFVFVDYILDCRQDYKWLIH